MAVAGTAPQERATAKHRLARLTRLGLAIAWSAVASAASAQPTPGVLGLWWGESLGESIGAAGATVVATTHHPYYGKAVDLDRLPQRFGGELSRILYFGDDDHLLRVWINFGHPGQKHWEANFGLDAAIAKYGEVKNDVSSGGELRGCDEPELRFVDQDGERRLDPSFERDRPVWSCEYQSGPTRLRVVLRRLGDRQGQRYDVIYDARAWQAVRAYQREHDPHPGF